MTWTRRDILSLASALALVRPLSGSTPSLAASLAELAAQLPGQASAQAPQGVPAAANVQLTQQAQQQISKFIVDTLNSFEKSIKENTYHINATPGGYQGYNGPEISTQHGPLLPYLPEQEQPETELEGASPDDFPPDYMKFDQQTGLFDNIIID
jgi:hypothetical protein